MAENMDDFEELDIGDGDFAVDRDEQSDDRRSAKSKAVKKHRKSGSKNGKSHGRSRSTAAGNGKKRKKRRNKKSPIPLIGIIALILIVFAALGSCSGKSSESKADSAESNTASVDGEDGNTKDSTGGLLSLGSSDSSQSSPQVTIEEQVLVDQDGIKVTAVEYTSGGLFGDGIKMNIENNTDKDLMLSCSALIVNDYNIQDLFAVNVAAGKKAVETLDLYSSELKAAGIDAVGQVEIYFRVHDSNTYEEVFKTDCITIRTSAYDNMDTTPDDSGAELYNEGGIRIVGKSVDEDSFWGKAILLYCENNSGRNVVISADDMSVNGYMMTPYFSATVYNGKKALDDITLLSTELEENQIDTIETVELKFRIYDPDSYETVVETNPITFRAQ